MEGDYTIARYKPGEGKKKTLVYDKDMWDLQGFSLEDLIEYFTSLKGEVPEGKVADIDIDINGGYGDGECEFSISYNEGYTQEEIDAAKIRLNLKDADKKVQQAAKDVEDLQRLTQKYPKIAESFLKDVTGDHFG